MKKVMFLVVLISMLFVVCDNSFAMLFFIDDREKLYLVRNLDEKFIATIGETQRKILLDACSVLKDCSLATVDNGVLYVPNDVTQRAFYNILGYYLTRITGNHKEYISELKIIDRFELMKADDILNAGISILYDYYYVNQILNYCRENCEKGFMDRKYAQFPWDHLFCYVDWYEKMEKENQCTHWGEY
jgi:hypothetical protein